MGRMSERGASLRLEGVEKRFGDVVAVDDIDLSVEPGEFVTLLGPSGSGKTTTLDVIAGFKQADRGEVYVDGQPVGHLPAYRREIGVVFQHYALFPHMTVFDNIAFPLKQRRRPRDEIERRVTAALDLVRLGSYGRRMPRQLSGGQQQRVAVARAVVFEPSLLLMDEPLGALDKKLREGLQLEIKRIHREVGLTFVHVTHDQDEALALSDRIAVFNEGRIEQLGTAEELYERPRTLFVADFLGESNVFRGRSSGHGGLVRVEGKGGAILAPGDPRVADGEEGVVIVRPEHLRLVGQDTPADSLNVAEGTIREVIYLGAARKLVVDLGWGVDVIVREQGRAAHVPTEGPVRVAWRPEDSVLLPGEEPSPLAAAAAEA